MRGEVGGEYWFPVLLRADEDTEIGGDKVHVRVTVKYSDYQAPPKTATMMVVEPLIVGLLLAAALMHASWNAILKSDQSDRLATFGVIMTTGTVMGLCAVPFLPWIEPGAWKYLAISVIVHVAYYTFLLKAYSYGDLSHTYPIARGLGPLLVALVSGRFIGEHLRSQDVAGVLLLTLGLIALALPPKSVAPSSGGRHGLATLFAVLTGFTIAAYIIADGLGVRAAGPTFEHRLSYIAWLCVLEGPWLLVLAIVLRPKTVWTHLRRTWWRGVIGGVIANTGTALRSMRWCWGRWPMSRRCARPRCCSAP